MPASHSERESERRSRNPDEAGKTFTCRFAVYLLLAADTNLVIQGVTYDS